MYHIPDSPISQEAWCDIPGYEGFYQASTFGRIRSIDRTVIHKTGSIHKIKGRVLRPSFVGMGYLFVNLSVDNKQQTRLVHRLVCVTFQGPPTPPTLEVNHLNGIKTDNRPENLEWVTAKENHHHAWKTGLRKPTPLLGAQNGKSKLTAEEVRKIKRLIQLGKSDRELSDAFSVTPGAIWMIRHGRTWKHVAPPLD